ncbi:MAG: hypothetical protein LUG18_06445 [Candidatus Azobacteroides sp.]|nr:hypothetical protein [Candidatus Azobacteroides sp.]
MKTKIITLFILALAFQRVLTCDCNEIRPFIPAFSDMDQEEFFLIKGIKENAEGHGMQVKVLENIKGAIPDETITVWLDNGVTCRIGYAEAYEDGETLYLLLRKTDLSGNSPESEEAPEKEEDYMPVNCSYAIARFSEGYITGRLQSGEEETMSIIEFYNYLGIDVPTLSFAPVGTEWTYGETYLDHPEHDLSYTYHSLYSSGDKWVAGKMCNTISRGYRSRACASTPADVYLYKEGNTIFCYAPYSGEFTPLYILDAAPGDSWTIDYPGTDPEIMLINPLQPVEVKVNSVETISIFDKELKVLSVTYSTKLWDGTDNLYPYERTGKIIEGIGDTEHLFNFRIEESTCCVTARWYQGLRCYSHPEYGTYNTGDLPCDYVTSVTTTEEDLIKISINEKDITIESPADEIRSVQLADITGKSVFKYSGDTTTYLQFPFSSQGIFICYVTFQSGKQIVKKLLF